YLVEHIGELARQLAPLVRSHERRTVDVEWGVAPPLVSRGFDRSRDRFDVFRGAAGYGRGAREEVACVACGDRSENRPAAGEVLVRLGRGRPGKEARRAHVGG